MSAESNHLGDSIQDLLDGRLAAGDRARAEAHLQGCKQCRAELEALRRVKVALREAARDAVTAEVTAAIRQALEGEDRSSREVARERTAIVPWRPLLALGVVMAVLAAAFLFWRGRALRDLPSRVASHFVEYERGRLPLELRTPDPRTLEGFFAARRLGFETHVFDLAMMKFTVVGGRVQDLGGGRPASFFVYDGPEGKVLICEMFRGQLTELPPGAAIRQHNGIDFHVYERDGLTMVFWREGAVICVLTARGNPEEVIQLAFAKATRIARTGRRHDLRIAELLRR